jgi:hypothetical protein
MRWACRCCSVACPRRRTALMRTVKSRGPDTPTLVSALMRKHHAHTVARKPGAPGRTRSSRSNHPRGECRDVSAEPVVPAACTFFRRRAMGAASARHSPCPLLEGRPNGKARTRDARREKVNACLNTIIARRRSNPESRTRFWIASAVALRAMAATSLRSQ